MHAFSSSIVVFLVMDHRVHHPHHGGGTCASGPRARCTVLPHKPCVSDLDQRVHRTGTSGCSGGLMDRRVYHPPL